MATVRIDGAEITDSASFHSVCRLAFGFPDYYGCNMDAWVDCLSYLRDDDNMSAFHLDDDEVLRIELAHADQMRKNAPNVYDEMMFCIEGINERYADYGEVAALELVLA